MAIETIPTNRVLSQVDRIPQLENGDHLTARNSTGVMKRCLETREQTD